MCYMDWLVITYRLPPEPSRHRVGVWRELRRVGAVALQQATWAVPDRAYFQEGVAKAIALVERADGEPIILRARAAGEEMAARLEALFTDAREQEWTEFLRDCDKFEAEIRREIRKRKFTAAELDEEEQNLERLRRWQRDLRIKDVFGAPSAEAATLRLKECAERLEQFADKVWEVTQT